MTTYCDCPSFCPQRCRRIVERIDAEDYDSERDGVCECVCHYQDYEEDHRE